jgi:hypothetical protein
MRAVILLARHDLRRRWRSALAVTLLVGIVGAIVLATAAGAHRSSTSLQRFVDYSRSSDMEVDLDAATPAQLQAFRRVPEVLDFAELHGYALSPRGRPSLKNAASVDGRIGVEVDRARVVAGRAANPDAPDEIMIGEGLAAQLHLGLGDQLVADTLSPAQFQFILQNRDPGPAAGPLLRLRIVGIYRRPLDLGNLAASGGVVIETQAFDRTAAHRIGLFTTILRVRTRAGARDVPAVTDAARRIFGPGFSTAADVSAEARGGADAIDILTRALWILAAVAASAGAVAIAIVLSRDIAEAGIGQPTLVALGLTRVQRMAALGIRVLVVGAVGSVIALAGAMAASPLFPIGIARRAEPTPGFHIDATVLAGGGLLVALFVAIVGLLAAIRATRRESSAAMVKARRSRRAVSELISASGLRPTAANGVRMALEPGRGTSALPVRSAFLGSVLGVAGLVAVLVFAASFSHLQSTPRQYGWTWDFKAPDDTFSTGCGSADYGLHNVPGVADVAAICYSTGIPIDGRPTTAWGFTPVRGSIDPEIVHGIVPRTRDEVALGAATMRALGKKIGDTVRVRGSKTTNDYRIVGQVVLPQIEDGEIQPLGDGAAFTAAGFAPLADPNGQTRYLVGKYAPGADIAAVGLRVDAIAAFNPSADQAALVAEHGASGPVRPPEVERLRAISWFPPMLAVVVGVLALIALAHALVTTTRRRRGELALLKTFGFRRGQVRATLAWQATTLAAVGLVFGIPIGLLLGRVVWVAVANSLDIAPHVVVPLVAVGLVVPAVVVTVNTVGFWPARAAARIWPATALAAE